MIHKNYASIYEMLKVNFGFDPHKPFNEYDKTSENNYRW